MSITKVADVIGKPDAYLNLANHGSTLSIVVYKLTSYPVKYLVTNKFHM